MSPAGEQPHVERDFHLRAQASGESEIYQAGRDQYIAGRDLHLHYRIGGSEVRRVDSATVVEECPYPGLIAFGPEQAQWFFGRKELTAQLLERLDNRVQGAEHGPLAVVAPSGAGKSSLLRAGLLPALTRGVLPGSSHWPCFLFTPTARPMTVVASCLAAAAGTEPERVTDSLSAGSQNCVAMLRERLPEGAGGEPTRLVMIIDQLEELFTLCEDERERRSFLDLLSHLVTAGPKGEPAIALVVYGLRADFYAACADYPHLRAALQGGQVFVGPMSEVDLREAVRLPAEAVGLEFEPGLVELLLTDLGSPTPDGAAGEGGYEAGRLPLLAHALRATWQQRHGHVLTVEGYRTTGRIQKAVATTADRVFETLSPADQQKARALFLRLVKIGASGEDSRRRVPREDLMSKGTNLGDVLSVADAFTQNRLLTVDHDTVEITHEALLHAWPRLRRWIDADRSSNLTRQELEEAADTWDRSGRDTAHLYRGSRLETAIDWAGTHKDDLSIIADEFLTASVRQQRFAMRLRRGTVTTLAVLVLIASVSAIVARTERDQAVTQRRIAIARQLTAQSAALAESGSPEASILNALEAFRQAPSLVEARSALLSSQEQYFAGRLTGHRDIVQAVAFSPDGRILASAGQDRTIRLWDVTHRTTIATLTGRTTDINDVAFANDDRTLATADRNGTIKLWDVGRRTEIATLSNHGVMINRVAFSPDGRTLATADDDGTARLWDLAHRTEIGILTGHTDVVGAVAFSPDGRTLATGSADHTVKLWNVARRTEIASLAGHSDGVNWVAFSANGRTLATASNDRTARIWDVAHRKEIATLTGHSGAVWASVFSPDGRTLATTSVDGTVKLWDVAQHDEVATLTGHTGAVWGAAFSPDGRTLATTSNDRSVVLWSMNGPILTPYPVVPAKKTAFSPDGRTLATTSNDDTVKLWDVARHDEIATLIGHTGAVWGAAFSPNGRILATTSADGTAKLWNLKRHKEIATLPHPGGELILGVAFNPDGHILATTDIEGEAKLWDVTRHKEIASLIGHTGEPVWGVAFSPDGHTLATVSTDKSVKLWNVAHHNLIATLTGHAGNVYGVAFSPDGRTIATSSDDKTVRLWDIRARRSIATLTGHTDAVWGVAFSPDGHTLATVSTDKSVKLWNVAHHNLIATLTGHTGPVTGVAFSPDGRIIATSSNDGSIRLWNTDTTRVTSYDCRLVGPISRTRWSQLFPELSYHPICP